MPIVCDVAITETFPLTTGFARPAP
jgi:hypothetical protein